MNNQMQEGLEMVGAVGTKVRNLGIFVAILGALAIWAPQFTGKTLAVVIGVLMIFGGVGRTMFSWVAPTWGNALLRAAVGILTIIAGGYIILQPEVGSKALAIVMMVYLIVDGVTSLVFSLRMPPVVSGGWMILGSLASIGLGVLMWMQWPASGELAVGLLIGVKLLFDGIGLIAMGVAAKSVTAG